jgi:hypothetical protein
MKLNKMIYQTASFSESSTCPTDEHTEIAIKNSLRVPTTQRFHMRIWFPHRANMIDQWWDWHRGATHHNMGPGIRNCKHVAVWCMVPESEEVHKESQGGLDKPLPDARFRKNDLGYNGELHIEYYTFINFQAYEYARTMTDLGYNVGFSSCVQTKPKSFNRTFGKHFNNTPVIPMIAVYVGTDGDVIQHTPQRDNIEDMDVSGELIGVSNCKVPRHSRLDGNKAFPNMPYFKPTNGTLQKLPADEVRDKLKVVKENIDTAGIRD